MKISQFTMLDIAQPSLLESVATPAEDESSWNDDLMQALSSDDDEQNRPQLPKKDKKPQAELHESPQYWLQHDSQQNTEKMSLGKRVQHTDDKPEKGMEAVQSKGEGSSVASREESGTEKKVVLLRSALSSYGEKTAKPGTENLLPQGAKETDSPSVDKPTAALQSKGNEVSFDSKTASATTQQTASTHTATTTQHQAVQEQSKAVASSNDQAQQAVQQSMVANLVAQSSKSMASTLGVEQATTQGAASVDASVSIVGLTNQMATTPSLTTNPSGVVQGAQEVMTDIDTAEVLEKMAQMSHGSERARIVVGEGEDRVSLLISSTRQQVQIKAEAASNVMAQAMQRGSAELREALSQHGIELSQFNASTNRDGSSHSQERQEARDQVEAPATVQETAPTARPGVRVVV